MVAPIITVDCSADDLTSLKAFPSGEPTEHIDMVAPENGTPYVRGQQVQGVLSDSMSEFVEKVALLESSIEENCIKKHHHLLRKFSTCTVAEVPDWLRDNDFIHSGYRVRFSASLCLKSLFKLHNETMNIWSHLLGLVLFSVILVSTVLFVVPFGHETITWHDRLVFVIFIASAQICLACSTLFHTFFCHSPGALQFLGRLDYSGIAVLIAGSFVPAVYYGFYCKPTLQVVYITLISIFGICTIVVMMMPNASSNKYRHLRAILFSTMGLMGVFPIIHRFIIYGPFSDQVQATLDRLLWMGFFYLVGAVLYAMRIPERFWPGKFDIIGHSHQLFHVLVVVAAVVHYDGCYRGLMYRLSMTCAV